MENKEENKDSLSEVMEKAVEEMEEHNVKGLIVLSALNLKGERRDKVLESIAIIEYLKKLVKEGKIKKEKFLEILKSVESSNLKEAFEKLSELKIGKEINKEKIKEEAVKNLLEEAKEVMVETVNRVLEENPTALINELKDFKLNPEEEIEKLAREKDEEIKELYEQMKELKVYNDILKELSKYGEEIKDEYIKDIEKKLPEKAKKKLYELSTQKEIQTMLPSLAIAIYRDAVEKGEEISFGEAFKRAKEQLNSKKKIDKELIVAYLKGQEKRYETILSIYREKVNEFSSKHRKEVDELIKSKIKDYLSKNESELLNIGLKLSQQYTKEGLSTMLSSYYSKLKKEFKT